MTLQELADYLEAGKKLSPNETDRLSLVGIGYYGSRKEFIGRYCASGYGQKIFFVETLGLAFHTAAVLHSACFNIQLVDLIGMLRRGELPYHKCSQFIRCKELSAPA